MGWTPCPRQTVGTCPFWSSCRTGRSVLTCLFGSRGSRPSSLCFSLPSFWKLPRSETCHVSFRRSSPPSPGRSPSPRISTVGAPRISLLLGSQPSVLDRLRPDGWAADTSPFPFRLIPPTPSPSSSLAPYRSRADLRRTPSCRGRPSETQPEGILSLCVCLSPCLCLCGVWQTHKSRRGR